MKIIKNDYLLSKIKEEFFSFLFSIFLIFVQKKFHFQNWCKFYNGKKKLLQISFYIWNNFSVFVESVICWVEIEIIADWKKHWKLFIGLKRRWVVSKRFCVLCFCISKWIYKWFNIIWIFFCNIIWMQIKMLLGRFAFTFFEWRCSRIRNLLRWRRNNVRLRKDLRFFYWT